MTAKCNLRSSEGFTLMELLVVLLIIGILSTVALRTIDATRDRSFFDQTAKEMGQLVQAITGNPDLTYDGRRVDFGFYGDMGKLPNDLRELVHNPNPSDTNWHGPYVPQTVGGDTASYLLDGWGDPYKYNPTTGTIASDGHGKYPMTVRVADSLVQLYNNTISGTITDADDNPPGNDSFKFQVTLEYSSGHTSRVKIPGPGGNYEFSRADTVPIGTHKLVARWAGDPNPITRWVTVAPRSQTIVDFRFGKLFRNRLRMVGSPRLYTDSTGFIFDVVNEGTTEDTVNWILFAQSPASAYMRTFWVRGTPWPIAAGLSGVGQGDTVRVGMPFVVQPNLSEPVELQFMDFRTDSIADTAKARIQGQTFVLRFNDGSEITATTPTEP